MKETEKSLSLMSLNVLSEAPEQTVNPDQIAQKGAV